MSYEALAADYRELLLQSGSHPERWSLPPDVIKTRLNEARSVDREQSLGNFDWGVTSMFDGVQNLSNRVQSALPKKDSGIQTYTGLFPTGSINAQARATANGALILLYEGIVGFLQQFIGIFLRQAEYQDRAFKRSFKPDGHECMDSDAAINAYSSLITRFLLGGPVPPNRFEFSGGTLGRLYHVLLEECLLFVLAHEHAHAALGHLGDARAMQARTTPVGEVEFIAKNWEYEFAADTYGIFVCLRTHQMETGGRATQEQVELATLVDQAANIFFCIDRLITDSTKGILELLGRSMPVINDHPPASERMKNARTYFQSCQVRDDFFERSDRIASSFEEIKDAVVDRVTTQVASFDR
jgi:hypothetical protein